MTINKPIKCASNDFNSKPFYLIQFNGENKRFVASFQDGVKIKLFLSSFIDSTDTDLQVQIRDLDEPDNPINYNGNVTKVQLKTVLEKYEELIFQDGFHDLMIRSPRTGDYIVFDEHGLVFVYTQDDYSGTLNKFGLVYQAKGKLIYEFDHWHYRPPYGREHMKELIIELGLNQM